MAIRRTVLTLLLLATVAAPLRASAYPGPGHLASGSGTLPGGATLGINAADLTGTGGTGSAIYTPAGGFPIRIALTCVVMGSPAPNLGPSSHFLGASGTGVDLVTYRITIYDVPNASDWAAVTNTPGPGPCGGPAPEQLGGDSYSILL